GDHGPQPRRESDRGSLERRTPHDAPRAGDNFVEAARASARDALRFGHASASHRAESATTCAFATPRRGRAFAPSASDRVAEKGFDPGLELFGASRTDAPVNEPSVTEQQQCRDA